MLTLLVVLSFPVLLGIGYGLLFVLCRRNPRVVTGPVGFCLYLALLTIPAGTVLATHSDRVFRSLAWHGSIIAWLSAGVLAGLGLWGVQRWGLPGRTPDASDRIWVGPPGRIGFVLLLVPVFYGVVAEESVWRAYLLSELGLPLPPRPSLCTTTISACGTWCSRLWRGWSGAVSWFSRKASGPRWRRTLSTMRWPGGICVPHPRRLAR